MFIHFFKLYLNLLILMSFPRMWCGKLFHSLMILTKKEYLKAFTFADFMRILNCCHRTQGSHGILVRLTQILSYNTLLKRSILFDAQACSSPVIRISLHMTSHVVFAQGQFLMLFVVCFHRPVCLLQGRVTILWLAYSNRGLTSDL